MNHRPTTIERAYELARSGECRTLSDVKQRLSADGHDRIQEHLYGSTVSAALRKLCQANYVPKPDEEAAVLVEEDEDD